MAYNYLVYKKRNLNLDNIIDVECFLTRRGNSKERIKNCTECNRYGYKNCELPIQSDEGALRLGYAVIYYQCSEYVHAWKECAKNKLLDIEKWLMSDKPMVLSCERYDGSAMVENLRATCEKHYGSFEVRYQEYQKKHRAILDELRGQLKNAMTKKDRKVLKEKIDKEIMKLNA